MANIVCFLAARAAKAGWDVREQRRRRRRGRAAARLRARPKRTRGFRRPPTSAGLGTDAIRWIPTDAELRMDVAALRRQIEADARRRRRAVPGRRHRRVGQHRRGRSAAGDRARSAGSTASGSTSTARTAASRPRCPRRPTICAALRLADSVAVDPHKWLYAPLEAGCALVRDAEALRAAFAYHPPYYHFDERATNYVDYGPQNSRGFRALKVWLALRQAGAAGYAQMIADDIRAVARDGRRGRRGTRSCELHDAGAEHHDVPLRAARPSRRASARPDVERHLDALNRELLDRLQRGGEAFVSNAVVGGRYVLRACIVNFHTDEATSRRCPRSSPPKGRQSPGRWRDRRSAVEQPHRGGPVAARACRGRCVRARPRTPRRASPTPCGRGGSCGSRRVTRTRPPASTCGPRRTRRAAARSASDRRPARSRSSAAAGAARPAPRAMTSSAVGRPQRRSSPARTSACRRAAARDPSAAPPRPWSRIASLARASAGSPNCAHDPRAEHERLDLVAVEHQRRQVVAGPQAIADAGFAVDRRAGQDQIADVAVDRALRDVQLLARSAPRSSTVRRRRSSWTIWNSRSARRIRLLCDSRCLASTSPSTCPSGSSKSPSVTSGVTVRGMIDRAAERAPPSRATR